MNNMLTMDLSLFDGATAGAGAGAGAGATATASPASTQGDTTSLPGNTRRGKSGELSNVVYGKQIATNATESSQAAAGTNTDVKVTSNTLEDRRKAYNELVNGQYKDIYTDDIQRIINRRFKETATLQSRVDETQPIIDMLMQRYGVENGDMKKLRAAIDEDDVYWSEAADEAGMTVEQYKKFQKLSAENARLARESEERNSQQFAREQAQKWYNEAEALKTKFPNFDFAAEIQNPQFISLLKAGTPVEHAFKVMHFDEIMSNAVNTTAVNTQKAVVENVRARGARPSENGTASQSAFTVKDDVHKLTRKDRAEIARRAKHGETISF